MRLPKKHLVGTYEHIVKGDLALDQSLPKEEFDQRYRLYLEQGNVEHLPLRPGAEALVFTMRHLVGEPYEIALEKYGASFSSPIVEGKGRLQNRLLYDLTRMTVESWKGLYYEDGSTIECERAFDRILGTVCVTEPLMAALQAGGVVYALGSEVLRRTFLGPLS